MSGTSIVLPKSTIMRGVQHRSGEKFLSVQALVSYLRKAALEPEQHEVSAQAFAMLADLLEEGI